MNPETFSGDQPLGQPAILLSLSPREKGSYPWFPFRYFHRHLFIFYWFSSGLQELFQRGIRPVSPIVLNLPSDAVAIPSVFISLSMLPKVQMTSDNAFYNFRVYRLYRYLCIFVIALSTSPFPFAAPARKQKKKSRAERKNRGIEELNSVL